MSGYIEQCIREVSEIQEDTYVSKYRRSYIMRIWYSNAALLLYAVLASMPFVTNVPLTVANKDLGQLFDFGWLGVLSIIVSFAFLIVGIKLKGGSSFYELPVIKQTIGKKEITRGHYQFLNGLAGVRGESLVKETMASLVDLNILNKNKVSLCELRTLEGCVVSRRVN